VEKLIIKTVPKFGYLLPCVEVPCLDFPISDYDLGYVNQFCSQALYLSRRSSFYLNYYGVGNVAGMISHSRTKFSRIENNLAVMLVFRYLPNYKIFNLRFLSKQVYNLAIEIYNDDVRSRKRLDYQESTKYSWDSMNFMKFTNSQNHGCRDHKIGRCLLCYGGNTEFGLKMFRTRILNYLNSKFAIRCVDRLEDSFLSFCDRLLLIILISKVRSEIFY